MEPFQSLFCKIKKDNGGKEDKNNNKDIELFKNKDIETFEGYMIYNKEASKNVQSNSVIDIHWWFQKPRLFDLTLHKTVDVVDGKYKLDGEGRDSIGDFNVAAYYSPSNQRLAFDKVYAPWNSMYDHENTYKGAIKGNNFVGTFITSGMKGDFYLKRV